MINPMFHGVTMPSTIDNQAHILWFLASEMELCGSNDVPDTYHWLEQHVAKYGLVEAIRWLFRYANQPEHGIDAPAGTMMWSDWKLGPDCWSKSETRELIKAAADAGGVS
jgi:hypothetical protein